MQIQTVATLSLLFLLTLLPSCKEDTGPSSGNGYDTSVTRAYKTAAGVDPDLLSLDIYSFEGGNPSRPVVIWVHGGGWRKGDKANKLTNKINLFSSLGYLLVSINYRLSPDNDDLAPGRIMFPIHNEDVASAVKWVYDSIGRYGGDPSRIALLGHSAGAHLVALSGVSSRFLSAEGLDPSVLKGVACIDGEYDIQARAETGDPVFINAFGDDPAVWVEASPTFSIEPGRSCPSFFVAKRGSPARVARADAFSDSLRAAGVQVEEVLINQYSHEEINDAIGAPGETLITTPLASFLKKSFQ